MENKKMALGLNAVKILLAVLGFIACVLVIGGPNATGDTPVSEIEAFRDGGAMGFTMSLTGFVIIACLALVLIFFIVQLITNPKKTVLSIIGILVVMVLYFILTMAGTSDTMETLNPQISEPVSQGTIDSTSAGIMTVIIAIFAAIAVVIWGVVKKFTS